MAKIDAVYSRMYEAKHESGLWIFKEYTIDDKDKNIRKKISEKFGKEEELCFDGKVIYNFKIEGHVLDKGPYKTTVTITKKGNEEVIRNNLCDLEELLIKNDFI